MTASQLSRIAVESLLTVTPDRRISTLSAELLYHLSPGSIARRVSMQAGQALLTIASPDRRISVVAIEVLWQGGSGPNVSWWDGSTPNLAAMQGWWDGTAIQPVTVEGWWDGTAIQPLA